MQLQHCMQHVSCNEAVTALGSRLTNRTSTKHTDVEHHFLRHRAALDRVGMGYSCCVRSSEAMADVHTQGPRQLLSLHI